MNCLECPRFCESLTREGSRFCTHSYNAGASVEYLGKRDKESMKTFALKAMSACVPLLLFLFWRV